MLYDGDGSTSLYVASLSACITVGGVGTYWANVLLVVLILLLAFV